MEISVIIPTFKRPAKIAACVAHLARQSLPPDDYEVLVGSDGPDPFALRAAQAAWMEHGGKNLRVIECPREGLAAVRNRLLSIARGTTMVSLNDDLLAKEDLLKTHADEHRNARNQGRGVIVSGQSDWVLHAPDRLFDRLIRETSMIFFPMDDSEPDKDWGFRHCWGLNFSAPLGAIKEVGGFAVFPAKYGYEDNEIAWRLRQRFGMPVLYRPKAAGSHDHRMDPLEYLEREYKLGYAAWGFAAQCPQCAAELFARDIRDPAEIAYSREYLTREHAAAARAMTAFQTTANLPADAINTTPEATAALRTLIYQQHLPLKRWMWRRGLVDAAGERVLDAGGAVMRLG